MDSENVARQYKEDPKAEQAELKMEDEPSGGPCLRAFNRYQGMLYAFLAGASGSLSQISMKKAKNLSGSEHSIIRNILNVIILYFVIRHHKLEYWGPKRSRSILTWRGIIGCLSLLAWSFAVMLIPPSDVISLIYVGIVITAILSRIFLKEMLGLAHIISVVLTLAGVFLIAQPEFLFKPHVSQNLTVEFLPSNNTIDERPTTHVTSNQIVALGIGLSLFTAFASGLQPILIKFLANQKVHYAVVTNYAAFIGVPTSVVIELILLLTGAQTDGIALIQSDLSLFFFEVFFSVLTALLNLVNQILFNLALEHEDPTKCTILRSFEVFLTFIWQRLFLGLRSNVPSILGAVCIFLGALGVVMFKLVDKKYSPVNTNSNQNSDTKKQHSKLRRCFFYKF